MNAPLFCHYPEGMKQHYWDPTFSFEFSDLAYLLIRQEDRISNSNTYSCNIWFRSGDGPHFHQLVLYQSCVPKSGTLFGWYKLKPKDKGPTMNVKCIHALVIGSHPTF